MESEISPRPTRGRMKILSEYLEVGHQRLIDIVTLQISKKI